MVERSSGRRQKLVLLIVFGILAALFCYWLFVHVKWVEEEIDAGWSDRARLNPFLAAKLFLQEQGVETEVARSFSLFDDMRRDGQVIAPHDTVILISAYGALGGQRADHLWQWVNAGGTLVASARNPYIDLDIVHRDDLLDRLMIQPVPEASAPGREDTEAAEDEGAGQTPEDGVPKDALSSDSQEGSSDDATVDDDADACPGEADTTVRFSGDVEATLIDYRWGVPFIVRGDGADASNTLRHFRQGEGDIFITADNRIWDNEDVGCFDHAYALWKMINPSGTVWLAINQDGPSLWRLLWHNARTAIVLGALALSAWMWSSARRFGAVEPVPPVARRRFMEHIRAGAVFLWRHRQEQQLVEGLRQEVWRRADRRWPALAQASPPKQSETLAHHTGLPESDIRAALLDPLPGGHKAFTFTVNRLQYLRNSL